MDIGLFGGLHQPLLTNAATTRNAVVKRGCNSNCRSLQPVRTKAAEDVAPYPHSSIPKGLRIKAQGCEERATLGTKPTSG